MLFLYLSLQNSLNSCKMEKVQRKLLNVVGLNDVLQSQTKYLEKFGNIKQAKKNLISTFPGFLTAIAKI